MKIDQALHWAKKELEKASSSPVLDAELLLAEILGKDRAFLMAYGELILTPEQEQKYRAWAERRKRGEPVAYLLGKKEFYGLEFKVDPRVLIPRPDTEGLVEMLLKKFQIPNSKFQIGSNIQNSNFQTKSPLEFGASDFEFLLVDVGTGSGCIAIAVLSQLPNWRAIGVDLSAEALELARENAESLGVSERVQFIESNLLSKLPQEEIQKGEWVLTANLPYLPSDWPQHASTKFEPGLALFGGPDGLTLYHRLAQEIEALSNKPRALFFEAFEFQLQTLKAALPSFKLAEKQKMTGEAWGLKFECIGLP